MENKIVLIEKINAINILLGTKTQKLGILERAIKSSQKGIEKYLAEDKYSWALSCAKDLKEELAEMVALRKNIDELNDIIQFLGEVKNNEND